VHVIRASCVFLWALAATFPSPSAADFIRDEVRINMRSGPGVEYRIVHVLSSGDELRRLANAGTWAQVRTEEGKEGWVPKRYLTKELPASVEIPGLRSRVERAEGRVEELQKQLQSQAESVRELSALRARATDLEEAPINLTRSARWKELAAGGIIVLVGMLIGALLPKGGQKRSRRLKL
jgi:uncharacterized protein YgiM (DUF1202 family)